MEGEWSCEGCKFKRENGTAIPHPLLEHPLCQGLSPALPGAGGAVGNALHSQERALKTLEKPLCMILCVSVAQVSLTLRNPMDYIAH